MPRDTHDAAFGASADDRTHSILSELEDADFQLVDPPDDVWAGIEAAITSVPASSPGDTVVRHLPANTIVEYSIDANDVVVTVGQNWAHFARDNDAPELVAPPANRTLWSYFDGDETTDVWRLLVDRVRATGQEAEVPLRCDAPHARRWLKMTIAPVADGAVRFRCELVFEETREPISLLDTNAARDVEQHPVALCSWCARVHHDSDWVTIEQFVRNARLLERTSVPSLAHGICATCRDQMSAELLVSGRHGESSP